MNNGWIKYGLMFVLVVLLQGLVVNNFEMNAYLHPMIYPVMILLLPFRVTTLSTMIFAIVVGLTVDAFSNTFGLHASSTLLIGYMRPIILRYIKPRDDYSDNLLPTFHDMGFSWYLIYGSIILFIHHFWFFSFEVFRIDLIFTILIKTIFSMIFSFGLILIFQYIFYKPTGR